jgi:hypothetical protein
MKLQQPRAIEFPGQINVEYPLTFSWSHPSRKIRLPIGLTCGIIKIDDAA